MRWWRPELPKLWAAGHAFLVLAFFALPLLTPLAQAPVDIAYGLRPWSAMVDGKETADNPLLTDIPLQMLPFRTLVRERWLALEPPLWSHEMGTGQPLLGNAQSAPFAPLHLMALPVPPLRGLTLAAAWQTFLGLLLMHALVLALGSWRLAAVLLAGLVALLAAFKVPPAFQAFEALPLLDDAAYGRLRLFWVLAVAVAGPARPPVRRAHAPHAGRARPPDAAPATPPRAVGAGAERARRPRVAPARDPGALLPPRARAHGGSPGPGGDGHPAQPGLPQAGGGRRPGGAGGAAARRGRARSGCAACTRTASSWWHAASAACSWPRA